LLGHCNLLLDIVRRTSRRQQTQAKADLTTAFTSQMTADQFLMADIAGLSIPLMAKTISSYGGNCENYA
jgi:hypothetical protein